MTGIEIAVTTYLFAWAKQRARKVGEQSGREVDGIVTAAMQRLHQVVVDKLGAGAQGMERLEREASEGAEEPSRLTAGLVGSSVVAAMEDDEAFAAAVSKAVADLDAAQSDQPRHPGGVVGNTFHGRTAVQSGHHNHQTNHFGA